MKTKQKIFYFFISLSLMIGLMFPRIIGEASAEKLSVIKEQIIQYNLSTKNVLSVEEWKENVLPNEVGITAEWYVLSLAQSGEKSFLRYKSSLLEYLQNKKVASASTRLKFALTLASIGSDDLYIQNTINDSIGKQGIMSLVYGLHFLNNGYAHNEYTAESLVQEIIALQNQDGGWSLNGSASDVDVTAMTVQALAKEYLASNQTAVLAVDKALTFLSNAQLEDGDYKSYGVTNPESGSQVIIALSALDVDFLLDERFIKNGKTLLDGIMKYSLSDGSFSHFFGGDTNNNSTVQVFCAVTAYERMKNGKDGFYILDSLKPQSIPPTDNSETTDVSEISEVSYCEQSETSNKIEDITNTKNNYKLYIIVVICAIWTVAVVLLFACKKMNLKNFAFISIFTIAIVLIVLSLNIQSSEEYYNSDISKENPIGTVTMSINCSVISNGSDNSFISQEGIILPRTDFEIEEGDTVYTILIEASRKFSIQVENNGTEKMAYISGINYLYEFDYGDLSGWMYTVNGKEASVGCTSYKLSDGDVIEWFYTLDMGKGENK